MAKNITSYVLKVAVGIWQILSLLGLPAVKLEPLLAMKNKKRLSDEDMVSFQKKNLIDIKSPNPSVETFLHAFLPFKFVDHTHADADFKCN